MKTFDNYSKYYDIFNQEKNYSQEAEYVLKLISQHVAKCNSLVEFGCGTGKHAVHFAKHYTICGVDFSPTMLEQASLTIKEHKIDDDKVKLICDNIQSVKLDQKYDVCVSIFHVMSYMQNNDQVLAVLKNARRHLNESGVFIFDCWYGPAVLKQRPTQRIKKLTKGDNEYIRLADPELAIDQNIVKVHYHIFELNSKTSQYNTYEETHIMRYYFEPEIQLFCQLSGFELVESHAWLTEEHPGEDNWGACFVLRAI